MDVEEGWSHMDVNSIMLVGASVISSMIMVLGAISGRRKASHKKAVEHGEYGIGDLLGRSLDVSEKFSPPYDTVFRANLSRNIVPDEFIGVWVCVKLGCGGWGCAYRCRRDEGVVVFKVPRGFEGIVEENTVPTVPEELLRRVAEEASVLSKLSHPHILRLLGYSSRIPLLIYEYADGGSLEWQLARGWRPSLRDTVLMGIQIGDALRYIHSRGLVHGDIKPGNIFLVDCVVKLGDFSSLVKLLAQTSDHSRFAYTPGWRAPEQVYSDLRRRVVERGLENRVDVYQLGNIVLYLLTGYSVDGEDVFKKDYVQQILGKVADTRLKSLLAEMLRPDPEERPSMDEVLRKLVEVYHELG